MEGDFSHGRKHQGIQHHHTHYPKMSLQVLCIYLQNVVFLVWYMILDSYKKDNLFYNSSYIIRPTK
jgi:hypothetical protein